MSLNTRIKERREQLEMSRAELAEKIGVTPSAIANYENGISSPKIELLYRLFSALDCDANYLYQDEMNSLGGSSTKLSYDEMEHIKKYRELDAHGRDVVDYILDKEFERCSMVSDQQDNLRYINYYNKLASAGSGQILFDDIPTELIAIPDVPQFRMVKYALSVNGSSMEPRFEDGDILLIEPTHEVCVGEIGIFIVDNEAYVKELGSQELISLNKDYPNIPLTEYSKCIGRVVDKLADK